MKNPKTAIVDIETTPLKAFAWGPKWETNLIEVIEQTRILSYSLKWLNGKHITKGWPDYKGYKAGLIDDEAITKDLWNLMDEADIIVAHNGRDFDVKVMNARFVAHELQPPSPYKVIDPKLEAKKYLRLPSYSLDDVCDYFKIGRKLHHIGFPLWKACMDGNDEKAWKIMKKYNKMDVVLLEKLYLLLRPWMQSHPNVGMFTDKAACPRCGSGNLQSRGFAVTRTMKYRRLQCQNCGGWMRVVESEERDKPMVSI